MRQPGQDPGHPPGGLTWAELVGAWRDRLGGWTALADELSRRGGDAVPTQLGTVERGLRRLARKGHEPGGQYGRWVARLLGVPRPIEGYLRWLGQYHSRFADLPVSLRRRQLALWDRPPITEAAAGAWVDLAMASVAFRQEDGVALRARLDRAAPRCARLGPAAVLEHGLIEARVASGAGDDAAVERHLARAREHLTDPALEDADAACYRARLSDAEAYRAARAETVDRARAIYEAIDAGTGIPFVDFRRDLGLAWCAWKLGAPERGVALAQRAADHAADGGFVRLRAMAFNLASRIADGELAEAYRARAARLSARLGDEELLARVSKPRGAGVPRAPGRGMDEG